MLTQKRRINPCAAYHRSLDGPLKSPAGAALHARAPKTNVPL
jgi:hypothetical protein